MNHKLFLILKQSIYKYWLLIKAHSVDQFSFYTTVAFLFMMHKNTMLNFALKLFLFHSFFVFCSALDCMDQDNQTVDWFLVYKIPQIDHTDELISNGLGYVYMTSKNKYWKSSTIPINSTNSILANTLSDLAKNSTSYILYNDSPPSGANNTKKGHTKGVVAFNGRGGYWMTHSLPYFPTYESYKFPKIGAKYGHMFLCFSMNLPYLNEVGRQLYYNQPNIYKSYISKGIKPLVPKLDNAARKTIINGSPWTSKKILLSKRNEKFLSIAKAGRDYRELYSDIIAPYLKQDLLVQSWSLDSKRYESECKRTVRINNVNSVYINEAGARFYSMVDQSKWAITKNESDTFWFCIGDLNRAKNHEYRSGGAICFSDGKLKKSLENLVSTVAECRDDVKPINRTIHGPVKKKVQKPSSNRIYIYKGF
ncbi:unnamed protein product [Psylliodes chrysocephalus]|uniref:Uncharacterized protein n=1 Tax=Psylliodes chrysocephalus TaxID=3402493 RepID=A0A9P0D7V4_9CUCU|nr:unnamed protein product [Psylliodes chrysocephala]